MHLFNLQRHVKDDEFLGEFLELDGPRIVIDLIAELSGNSLAVSSCLFLPSCGYEPLLSPL
jgi:hypothetical protein